MHASSYKLMKKIVRLNLDDTDELNILDVGSRATGADRASGYRPLFEKKELWTYCGMDMQEGNNVDLVVTDPYCWSEIEDESYDVVISGQVMEHIEAPWLWVKEVARVCKVGGRCVIIAPFVWHQHRYPVDCYRYLPDGMKYLFTKVANFESIRCRLVDDDCLFFGERMDQHK